MRKRVLLVDDDLDVLDALELALSRSYDILTATDGHAALAVLAAQPVDVAVVDVMMPGMDGDALVAAMQARGSAPPVILASATPELSRRADQPGVFAALAKPFTTDELARCIAAALAAAPGDAGGAPSLGPPPASGRPGPAAGGPTCAGRSPDLPAAT